jgi:diguanylate cyclase (GGDEF)-like protein
MGEQGMMWLAGRWERLITVNTLDEEETRQGRLFNILMIISIVLVIFLVLLFLLMIPLGMAETAIGWTAAVFPLSFIPLSIFCIIQAQRGRIRSAIRSYIWVTLFSICLAAWIFDGIYSPAWLLHIWTITIAGTLLAPAYALWMTGGVVAYFLLLFFLYQSGLYVPPLTFGPAGREFANISFLMLMLISTVGLLTYLNMRSLRDTLMRLRMKTKELEEHRRTLEQRVKERTEELIKTNAELDKLATHDALTGLPNRMMYSQLLNRAIQSARRYDRQFAVFFIDLDRFKIINDTLGHGAGDQLLQEIALRLKQAVRSADVVARLGGDEFVLLVDEVNDLSQVATVAHKVLSAASKPMVLMGEKCRVTASIGISIYPKDAEDEQSLMKTADIALYLAKEEGKNNYQFYSKEIQSKSIERLSIETNLRSALEHNEFSLHYQAKLDFKTGAITGVEALLRWQNPYLGSMSPTQFIPVAEETGLIVPIGRWVLKTACAQNVAWQRQGLPLVCIAVNLSLQQLTDDNLLDDIGTTLKDSGMEPSLLELEITESMLMHKSERVIATLTKIKNMGVRLAIDDFGTGYSSLAQIKHLPIDTIKVDRSFIRNLLHDTESKAIIKAIIAMGKTLSLSVVAEGVETQEQMDFLREHACDGMYGYFFNRPATPDQFADLLRNQVSAL